MIQGALDTSSINSAFNDLTAFATTMVGLSVASERVTETIKQWVAPYIAKMTPAGSTATVQVLAIISGIVVTAISGLDPLKMKHGTPGNWMDPSNWAVWLVGGIMVSGGSAFWNHILDMLKATKVQKELQANAAAVAANIPKIAP
jgi:hypothetical protein